MNVSTSARLARQNRVVSTTDAISHTSDALASQLHASSAANDEAKPVADEPMVNPLWMITVGLGAFFCLGLLLLASG